MHPLRVVMSGDESFVSAHCVTAMFVECKVGLQDCEAATMSQAQSLSHTQYGCVVVTCFKKKKDKKKHLPSKI